MCADYMKRILRYSVKKLFSSFLTFNFTFSGKKARGERGPGISLARSVHKKEKREREREREREPPSFSPTHTPNT